MSRRRGPRGAARSLIGAVLAAGGARGAYALLRSGPPGGAATWTRTNHRGEPVTLLEGPAAATGAALAAALTPGLPARTRAALVTAAAGAGALGGYDDLAGSGDRRGFRGHLGALAQGEVTTGAVKIGGIGATGLAASALLGGGPLDVAVNAGLIAGGANLLNLFDLRPGRAIKVAALAGGMIAATGRPAGGAGTRGHPGGHSAGRRSRAPGRGSRGTGHAGRRRGQRPRGHARRRGRGEPATIWPGRRAGWHRRAHRGQREDQLHQGHPADTAAALARHARPPSGGGPRGRVTGRHPGPGSHGS